MRDKVQGTKCEAGPRPSGEQGFMLLGLIVVIAIILMVLGIAASEVAFSLRREREAESARRADQYVRAIRRFYLKTQHYPGSIEQLENTNRVRYLRQRYVDPLTGKADYRLIPVGQNKTTVKGFFGLPLAGIASTGLGSVAGMQSPGIGGTPTASSGTTSSFGTTAPGATTGPGASTGQAGSTDSTGAAGQTSAPFTTGPFGTGSGLPGATGPFMGVGSSAKGNSILVVNEQTTYESWEFLYDPRIEKLKAAAALNAGASSVGAGGLGQTPGAIGGSTNPSNPSNSTNPLGNSTTTGAGSSSGGTPPPTQP
jgi:type II secretory pathway pseudopilin PulG